LPGEGGFYRETYRSKFSTTHTSSRKNKIKVSQDDTRSTVTLIYCLLEGKGHFSAFHKLKSDEIWHFYRGSSVTIYVIDNKGHLTELGLEMISVMESIATPSSEPVCGSEPGLTILPRSRLLDVRLLQALTTRILS
jgi:predicted cupin superfamily sugar epimerase